MKNSQERDVFWETDLVDIQKTYLPKGMLVTDLSPTRVDWRVPVRGCPLIATGRIARLPKDKLERRAEK